MTNCPICNRETNQDRNWCDDCLTEWKTYHSYYCFEEPSLILVAEWAANRAREFERDGINKLIEELKYIVVSLSQETGENTDSGQYYAYLINSSIKEYKKE